MKMKLLSAVLAGLFSLSAQAATFDETGSIANVNDVYKGWFVVDNAVDNAGVTLSTNSYAANNFDPFLAVWALDGTLLWFNDDKVLASGDSYIDAGVVADGKYYFTLSNSPYIPKTLIVGTTNLSDGFYLSDYVVDPVNGVHPDTWGRQWNMQISGVTSVGVVPEPESWAMLLAGLGLVGAVARRRKQ